LAGKKEDTSILRYCANTFSPHIADLGKAAKNIIKRDDIEDIHDLRVASRRIRSVLNSFSDYLPKKQYKNWIKDIQAITKAYGKVRDIDVQLDLINKVYSATEDKNIKSGIRRVKLRLEQKRKSRQDKTTQQTRVLLDSAAIIELSDWTKSILEEAVEESVFSAELYQLGYKQIQNQLDEFLFYEVFIFDSHRVEELHAMRISAKKLRYALEVFSDLYSREIDFALDITKQAQDYLGEIHDCDVWIEFLPKFMEKEFERIKNFYGYTRPYRRIRPGIEYLIENRKKERERLYQLFLKDWKDWKLKETWLNLRKVIFLTSLESQTAQSSPPDSDEPNQDAATNLEESENSTGPAPVD